MKTKIVATIGPASRDEKVLRELIDNGMSIARVNASFADHEEMKKIKDLVKSINPEVLMMADLMGHKIRIRGLEEPVELKKDQSVIFNCGMTSNEPGEFEITYEDLFKDIQVGHEILVDDGKLKFTVEKIEGTRIITKVDRGGTLKKGKTVNVPQTHLNFETLTEKDKSDLVYALELDFDMIAVSFVRDAEDVKAVKSYFVDKQPMLISKIENPEGVENYNEILSITDGIMVARGDLGVELPIEQIPLIQKMFVKRANAAGKFVIVATEMLASMVENPTPTRAEVSDIANAVLDGADGIMLSAETATGQHPVEAVKYMNRIASYIENHK